MRANDTRQPARRISLTGFPYHLTPDPPGHAGIRRCAREQTSVGLCHDDLRLGAATDSFTTMPTRALAKGNAKAADRPELQNGRNWIGHYSPRGNHFCLRDQGCGGALAGPQAGRLPRQRRRAEPCDPMRGRGARLAGSRDRRSGTCVRARRIPDGRAAWQSTAARRRRTFRRRRGRLARRSS